MKTILKLAGKFIAASLMTFMFCNSAMAETEGGANGGGGIGFLCNEQGTQKLYLADTYHLTKSGLLSRFTGDIEMKDAVAILNKRFPQKIYPHPYVKGQHVTFGFMLAHSLNGLSFDEHPLKNRTNDDNIKPSQIPRGCRKVQVAYQDLKRNIVQIRKDPPYLSGPDWFYLKLHEALISLRNRPGMDTTPIRNQVKEMATILSNPKNFALATLQEMAKAYVSRPIVPPDQRRKYRTMITAPRQLLCDVTWAGERGPYREVQYTIPSVIKLMRTSGDGRVGDYNKYSMVAGYRRLFGLVSTTQTTAAENTRFYTESYNAFNDPDGIGTFSLSMELHPNEKTDMQLSIDEYDFATGEFIGSFEVDSSDSMRVVVLGSGYGLRCWPSEFPVFRVDPRSATYDK